MVDGRVVGVVDSRVVGGVSSEVRHLELLLN
jgi:hypothetical protein